MLTTVAWTLADGSVAYALEGAIFSTGSAVQWLRDGLGVIASAAETGPLAATVDDSAGVFLVPAFTGLGSPWWDPYARGTVVGITRGTTSAHLARAVVDAMSFQTRDAVEAMVRASGTPLRELRVDGGAAVMDLLLQQQADQLGVTVLRPVDQETTALGAAYLAGLAEGVWPRSGRRRRAVATRPRLRTRRRPQRRRRRPRHVAARRRAVAAGSGCKPELARIRGGASATSASRARRVRSRSWTARAARPAAMAMPAAGRRAHMTSPGPLAGRAASRCSLPSRKARIHGNSGGSPNCTIASPPRMATRPVGVSGLEQAPAQRLATIGRSRRGHVRRQGEERRGRVGTVGIGGTHVLDGDAVHGARSPWSAARPTSCPGAKRRARR